MKRISRVRESVGVFLVDQFSLAAPTLRTALSHMPTLKLIVEAELDHDTPGNKVALVFVAEHHLAKTPPLIGRLKARLPSLPILIAFQALSSASLQRLLEAGADAFIMLSSATEDFRFAVMALAQGNVPPKQSVAVPGRSAKERGVEITCREAEILRLLSAGFSNKETARRLGLSVRTVETHRLNLRRKTQTGRLHDLVLLARHLELEPVPNTPTLEVPQAA